MLRDEWVLKESNYLRCISVSVKYWPARLNYVRECYYFIICNVRAIYVVSYAAVLRVVTQRSSPRGALRDDPENSCVGERLPFIRGKISPLVLAVDR